MLFEFVNDEVSDESGSFCICFEFEGFEESCEFGVHGECDNFGCFSSFRRGHEINPLLPGVE